MGRASVPDLCRSIQLQQVWLDRQELVPNSRAFAEAWAIGGLEGERKERELWQFRERQKTKESLDAMRLIKENAQKKPRARKQQEKNGVCGSVLGSVVPPSCVFVYRGFAQCLVTLGDEVNSQNDNDPDIDSICRSWDSFERCVSSMLSECRGNAAELWESLKVESRRTEFSGNLYEMCASRILTSPGTAVTTDQINQESLKGQGVSSDPVCSVCLLMACMFCALIWFV